MTAFEPPGTATSSISVFDSGKVICVQSAGGGIATGFVQAGAGRTGTLDSRHSPPTNVRGSSNAYPPHVSRRPPFFRNFTSAAAADFGKSAPEGTTSRSVIAVSNAPSSIALACGTTRTSYLPPSALANAAGELAQPYMLETPG